MRRIIKSVFYTLFFLSWIGGYIYFIAMTGYAKPLERYSKTDAIVVLTGGNYRVKTGLTLLADGMASELFLTGVNKAVTENEIRKLWKGTKELPTCCISLGHSAETTLENADETKKWLDTKKFKSIRLVTSTYHLQRAMLEFQYSMPDIKIIPHPVEDEDYSPHESKFWLITFSEYNKYIFRGLMIGILKGLAR